MKVNCQDYKGKVKNGKFITDYLNNLVPFSCNCYERGIFAECEKGGGN